MFVVFVLCLTTVLTCGVIRSYNLRLVDLVQRCPERKDWGTEVLRSMDCHGRWRHSKLWRWMLVKGTTSRCNRWTGDCEWKSGLFVVVWHVVMWTTVLEFWVYWHVTVRTVRWFWRLMELELWEQLEVTLRSVLHRFGHFCTFVSNGLPEWYRFLCRVGTNCAVCVWVLKLSTLCKEVCMLVVTICSEMRVEWGSE